MTSNVQEITDRKAWLGILAKAAPAQLDALLVQFGALPDHDVLRQPEIGGAMVRGRIGAVGQAFNLGEMTVTRCSVKLTEGAVGHGYVQGRDKAHAHQAALVDAMMQTGQAELRRRVALGPLEAEAQARKTTRAAKAAATKVDFFTMVRGEN